MAMRRARGRNQPSGDVEQGRGGGDEEGGPRAAGDGDLEMATRQDGKGGEDEAPGTNRREALALSVRNIFRKAMSKGSSLDELFGDIDVDRDGDVTTTEMRRALGRMPDFRDVSSEDVDELMEMLNRNGNGKFSLQEFKEFVGARSEEEEGGGGKRNEDEGGDTTADENGAPAVGGGRRAAARGGGRRGGGGGEEQVISEGDDVETQRAKMEQNLSLGPLRVLKAIRADPIKVLQARQKRIERLAASNMPEMHFVGQITSGQGLIGDSTEGVCCR